MTAVTTADASRKRLRSESGASSTSGASSPKRAASLSPAIPGNMKSPLTTESSLSVQEKDVDEVIQSQSQALSLTDDPSPGPSTETTVSPKQRLDEIKQLQARQLKLGETWYIVARSWYRNWASACGGPLAKGAPESERQVGSVDNSAIAGPGVNKLSGDGLEEGINIELVPQEAWDLLVSWYGQPSHTFGRKVIAEGVNSTLRIEFYPIACLLYICRLHSPPPPRHIEFTKTSTLADLCKKYITPRMKELKQVPFRIWKIDSTDVPDDDDDDSLGYTPQRVMDHKASYLFGFVNKGFESKKVSVEEALISTGDRIIIEVKEADDKYHIQNVPELPAWYPSYRPATPPPTAVAKTTTTGALFGPGSDFFTKLGGSTLGPTPIVAGSTRALEKAPVSSSSAVVPFASRSRSQQPGRVRGTMGLNNLGNTCYMNSALQCLAHLPELTEYFLSGAFQRELNLDNPLSTGGELAKSYGALLQSLFNDPLTHSVAPRDFKMKIARHNPTFSGYMQHDTQELLAFLLDGLHEDLNRILKKPYVENPEWEGGAELELCKLARDFWAGYKKRNDSVIVDLFQGQYKSTLVCPECQKVSVTFDPFMYLTLPLPFHKTWEHEVYFVTWDNDRPNYKLLMFGSSLQTQVMLPSTSTFRDIKVLLGKWFKAEPDNMLAADIFQSKIYRLFPDYHGVSEVLEHDVLFFYELPIASGQSSPSHKPKATDPFVVPVYTISQQTNDIYRRYTSAKWNSKEVWGFPFFIAVDPKDPPSEDAIYTTLVERYEQVTGRPHDLYKWEEQDADTVMVSAPNSQGSDGELVDRPTEEDITDTDNKVENAADPFDDLEELKLPTYTDIPEQDTPSTPQSLIKVSPKPELFTWSVMENNFELSPRHSNGAGYDVGRGANLGARLAEVESAMQEQSSKDAEIETAFIPNGFLRPKDGLVCEWDPNIRQLYFGDKGMGLESRWNATEDYVDEEQQALRASQSSRLRGGITIDDCLNEFVKEEKLGEADPWYCPRCKKHQQATKKFDIWKVPDILVVHLKRFSNSRVLRDKIDVPVDFPVEGLDLEGRVGERAAATVLLAQDVDVSELGIQNVKEPLVYDLFAVDEHMGGLGGGHYRSYAKNAEDVKWYHFDDSRVDISDPKDAVTNLAYLLFYRRRTATPVGGQTTQKIEEARVSDDVPPLSDPKEPEQGVFGSAFNTDNNLFASGSNSSPPWLTYGPDEANDPFPASISQLGSPRSIPTPTTPDPDSDYRVLGRPGQTTYTTNRYRSNSSRGEYASDLEDDVSERWAHRNGDQPSAHPPGFPGLLSEGDGIPMLSSDDEVMMSSSGHDYLLRSVTNERGVDEDYDEFQDQDEQVDEILVEGPLVMSDDAGRVLDDHKGSVDVSRSSAY
ncbi:CSN-associated deubiquitinating enzyme Ubp12 [Tulasnella sp. 330]|nr:CSN-associated deubiquitinating enzyme Ubp12 [Tulasnella sp. 330]